MSMMSMALVFTNATAAVFALTKQSGVNNSSGKNQAPSSLPANASTTTVTATGTDVAGFVTYAAGNNSFTFNFDMHLDGSNAFTFSATNDTYVAVISGNPMGTDNPVINVRVETAAQAKVTLAGDYANTHDFVQSLFATNARGADLVLNYSMPANPVYPITDGSKAPSSCPPFCVGIADQTSIQRVVSLWLALWQNLDKPLPQPCLQSDADMLLMLDSYLLNYLPSSTLWVPNLQFKGWQGTVEASPPVYTVTGYSAYALADAKGNWNANNLQVLLTYLVYGAHVVVITDATDVGVEDVAYDFYNYAYKTASVQPNLAQKVWDSHYSDVGGQDSGMSYPCTIITSDSVPAKPPLICAFLIGPTVQPTFGSSPLDDGTPRCDFMQLEGWRQFGQSSSGWHNADYDAYNETLWNFSTYGACAFSEKRGTALFLAPSGWTAKTQAGTIMPPYLGAQTPQSWLRTDLVALPQAEQTQLAQVTSSDGPINGNKHNSSPNFQISTAPTGPISVWMPAGITAKLWHVIGFGGKDQCLADLSSGSILPQKTMQLGNYNYYIGDPVGAKTNFTVTFTC